MNPKVLVTGAGGFLGSSLISLLKKNNINFFGILNIRDSQNVNSPNYIKCDLSESANVTRLLKKIKPDVIVNLAAKVDFETSIIEDLFEINILLPSLLASFSKKEKAFLIQSSGIIVHGFQHEIYSKDTPLTPALAYGKSKLLADELIMASGCDCAILRIGGVFGKNGPAHLGINNAIKGASEGKIPTIVGNGDALRNYIYVKDVSRSIIRCIKEKKTGIHYLGGEKKSMGEMLGDICNIFFDGKDPNFENGDEVKDRLITIDNSFPFTPFKEALKEIK